MAFDPITETVLHFIGIFEIAEENARSKIDFQKFTRDPQADPDNEALVFNGVRLLAPHELEGYKPGLAYKPAAPDMPRVDTVLPQVQTEPAGPIVLRPEMAARPETQVPPMQPTPEHSGSTVTLNLAPPSSMAAISVQISVLHDNDVFGGIAYQGPAAIEQIEAFLGQLASEAATLSPISLEFQTAAEDWLPAIKSIMDSVELYQKTHFSDAPVQNVATSVGAFEVYLKTGTEAVGIHVDGSASAALPEWDDLQPDFYRPSEDAQTVPLAQTSAEADGKAVAGQATDLSDAPMSIETGARDEAAELPDHAESKHDFSKDFDSKGGSDAEDVALDGHKVVTGANREINEVSINSSWLDSSVMSVAGNVLRYDAISQVNVLVADAAVAGSEVPDNSTIVNGAQLSTVSAPLPEDAATPATGAPAASAVVRIETDVTQINWVEQTTFTSDNDSATFSISGSAIYLGLGENGLFNEFFANEVGFFYDLIFVGGDVIDVNLVSQLNVLYDVDKITTDAIPDVAGTGQANPSEADEVLATPAVATAPLHVAKAVPDGDPIGTLLETDSIDLSDASEPDPVAAKGISTGDNLLFNKASIETVGKDIDAPLTTPYAQTLDSFAKGGTSVSSDVVEDPAFSGIETLRTLYIAGNFTTVNAIKQTNVMGDADHVHLARDAFAAAKAGAIEVTTGSNVLANFAKLVDTGRDTTVMAKGSVYSDALIHQAGLLDPVEGFEPPAAMKTALPPEAVAFLTDDTAATDLSDMISASTSTAMSAGMGQVDLMQTMLG